MVYQWKNEPGCDFVWQDCNKNCWRYTKKTKERLFGDVRRKSILESKDSLVNEECTVTVEPCKKKIGFFEGIRGYIPCQDEFDNEGYIRIIGRSKAKIIAFLILLFALIGAVGYIGAKIFAPADDTPIEIKSGELVNPNPENIRLPGIETVYASAGDTRVSQLLLNVEGNAVRLTYEIRLEENDELLYRSKVIKPGYGVREFDMLRTFEKGTYPITITAISSAEEDSDGEEDAAYNAGQLKAVLVVD